MFFLVRSEAQLTLASRNRNSFFFGRKLRRGDSRDYQPQDCLCLLIGISAASPQSLPGARHRAEVAVLPDDLG